MGGRLLGAYEDYARRASQRVWLRMGAHELPACQEWDLNDDSETAGMIEQPQERPQQRATRKNRIQDFRKNFGFQPCALAR